MSFTNITDEELVGKGVTGLPDTPGLTTEEMQAQFDEYSVFLKDKFKGLIAELEAATAALNIGADVPQNITADGNIQSILEGLRQYVDDTVVAIGTSDMATAIYDPDRDGIIAPAQGGTGQTTLQATRNAMGLGDTTGALPIANGGTGQTTAAGVRNALGLGETTGALPIANGGTGQTTAAGVRNALGLGNTTGALPVANGGTGKTSISSGTVLVGNGTEVPSERGINATSGGVQNSDALTTAGALYATKTALQSTFQDGVDAVYNACVLAGVTPSASTPTAIATAISNLRKTPYTGTYKPTERKNNNDMGVPHNKRYVDTTAVPNTNSATYSFASGDTGGTKDLGETNTYRYVNAGNVYQKGAADGKADKYPYYLKVNKVDHATLGTVYALFLNDNWVAAFDGLNANKLFYIGYGGITPA